MSESKIRSKLQLQQVDHVVKVVQSAAGDSPPLLHLERRVRVELSGKVVYHTRHHLLHHTGVLEVPAWTVAFAHKMVEPYCWLMAPFFPK